MSPGLSNTSNISVTTLSVKSIEVASTGVSSGRIILAETGVKSSIVSPVTVIRPVMKFVVGLPKT